MHLGLVVVGAANVLKEEIVAARPQHAGDLGERRRRATCLAENQRAGHAIEAGVLERQPLGAGSDDFDRDRRVGAARLKLAAHRSVWLGANEPRNSLPRIGGEVEARASADFKHFAARCRERLAALICEPGLLAGPHKEAVVDQRRKTVHQGHLSDRSK